METNFDWTLAWVLAAGVFIATWSGTRVVIDWLKRRQLLDHPNARSSHSAPTPRGGGLAMLAAILPALLVVSFSQQSPAVQWTGVIVLSLVLGAVSWRDDSHGLSPLFRFSAHLIVVIVAAFWTLPGPIPAFSVIPLPFQFALIVTGWVWFINLFNFMDGIDGIAGVETLSIAAGAVLIGTFKGSPDAALILPGLVLSAAALAFLIWNWSPAAVFLGDVGSVTLGFLLGWLLIVIAAKGDLAAAIILPLYYLTDATWTLFKRLIRREKIWHAHRQHFYQQAVARGISHNRVSFAVLMLNVLLVALAMASVERPLPALFLALLSVTGFLFYLKRMPLKPGRRLFRKPPIDDDPAP